MAAYLEYGLDGRGAIVTGGGTGVGAACATELAKAGVRVAISGRRIDPLEETMAECNKYTPGCIALPLDVSDSSAVKEAVRKAAETFGRLDVLVNNAGIDHDYKRGEHPFEKYFDVEDEEEYLSYFKIHTMGHYYMMKECCLYMAPAKFGRIVNVTSVLGLTGGMSIPPYTASKAAAIIQTKAFARRYGKHNIAVNSVAPGFVNTPMKSMHIPEDLERIAAMTPLCKSGEPIDIARVVMFFAQEHLFITGQNIVVDGGSNM